MRVKSISYAGKADVYNMEVDGTHNYAVENGAIVHNCYDECRYIFMEMPIAPPKPTRKTIPTHDPLNLFATERERQRPKDLYEI